MRLLRQAGFADIEYREQSPVPIGYSIINLSMDHMVDDLFWFADMEPAETGATITGADKSIFVSGIIC